MTKHRLPSALLLVFFAVFMVYPLSHVLWRAFFLDGSGSLSFFRVMFTTELYREVLINSLNIALAVTVISTAISYPLALVMARVSLPAAGVLHAILLSPLVVPPFVGVLGIRQLLSRFGSLNVLLLDLGLIDHPIRWLGSANVFGIIALQVVHLVPILYLSIRASLENTHISLEEAAMMSGASRWRVLRSVTIPLSLPGWFAGATLVFIASFTDLGTPLIFEYREVISVQIYNMLSDLHENPVGYAFVVFTCALSIILFTLSKASVFTGSFAGSGRAREGRMGSKLSPLKVRLAMLAVITYAAIACIPQITLVLVALSREWFMSVFPQRFTLAHFAEVITHPMSARSLVISLCLSLAASLVTVVIGFFTAHIIARGSRRARLLFEALSIIPLAVPGLVFAFGFIGAFMGTILDNRVNPFPLLIAAYAVRRLPAMVRSATAGLQEASRSLEEAALMVGASPLKVTRRITFPLIRRHLIVGAMLTFTYSMIEVSDSLLLALEAKFYPVAKAIYALMGRGDGIEVASALGVLVMVLMLVTFYLSERLSRGLSLTRGVKGLVIIGALAPIVASAETDELVGISPHWEAIRYEFTTGFAKHWKERTGRDLTIRWLDIGGTSDIIKYVRGQFKQEPNGIGIDFVFGGGSDSYIELERLGALEPASIAPDVLKAIPARIAGVPLYSERLTWFANALAAFGIIYNKAAVERLKLPTPRAWSDLADPRYFGYVGASDPRKSGSMHTMYEIILQGYGWDRGWGILQKIARNVGHFMGSASQVGKEIATGEVIYGVTIDTYAAETIHQVGAERVSFVVPSDFAVVNGDAIGMLKGAPNPRAASAFIEFTLSEAGQRIWYSKIGAPGGPIKTAIGKLSVLPSLYGRAEPAGIFKDNPFTLPQIMAYDAAKAAARWNLVNDLFGVFIIDSHKRLKRAPSAEQLYGIPVSESEAVLLGANGGWGADSALRTTQLQRWSEAAAAALPLQATPLDRLRWLPGAFFVCALIWTIIRRLT